MNAELPGGLVAIDPIANPEAVAMGEFFKRLHQQGKAKELSEARARRCPLAGSPSPSLESVLGHPTPGSSAQQKTESLRWWVWLLAGSSALNTLLLAALLLAALLLGWR